MSETNCIQMTGCVDDSLRTRIANTLYQELSIELPAAIRGADAVIRELALRQEWCVEYTPEGQSPATTQLAEWSCSHERITNDHERAQWDATSWARDFPDEQPHVVARYVTEWKTDDV